jgi:hypothetical protein
MRDRRPAPTVSDRAVVAAQIEREPRGEIAVEVRCPYGLPMVARTSPRLEDGTPFPTLYWLTCPLAVQIVSRLEGAGAMRAYEGAMNDDPELRERYRAAHEEYLARRDAIARLDDRSSAGGMPDRVKCLHALYAHELADTNPIGALVRAEVEPLGCPGPCVEERDGRVVRVSGHPAAPRKKPKA